MKKAKRFKNIFKRDQTILAETVSKVAFLVSILYLGFLSFSSAAPTSSFFSDSVTIPGNTFSMGTWSSDELTYTVAPPEPDGKNGWYKTHPCVTLTLSGDQANNPAVVIYYKFSHDGKPWKHGQIYSGQCVVIPEGVHHFQAQAVEKDNLSGWKSNLITLKFKVDTTPPCKPHWHFPQGWLFNGWDEWFKSLWEDIFDDFSGTAGYIYEERKAGEGEGSWKDPFAACGPMQNGQLSALSDCFADIGRSHNLTEGAYERRVKAIDEAGNESEWSDVLESEFKVKKPEINITLPDIPDIPEIPKINNNDNKDQGGIVIPEKKKPKTKKLKPILP